MAGVMSTAANGSCLLRPSAAIMTGALSEQRGRLQAVAVVRCGQRKVEADPLGRILRRIRGAPEEEKMTKRSPLDFPVEWERRGSGTRRADIFPTFTPMKPPLPQPMPGDPEEEEDEEEKEEEEENPEEEPEEKPEE